MPLEIIDTVASLRSRLGAERRNNRSVGLVPTMGALHGGHAALLARARGDCDVVVVSVFVNPLQFDRREDLERYPRDLEADAEACRAAGADVLFAPPVPEMYPEPAICRIHVGRLGDHLCGRYRPGHFEGVATVVMKLLQIVQPDVAYFGEKDAQQLAIVRRLVFDFNVPVSIVGVPTVREPDGLALSSRNRHLDAGERELATVLYRTLADIRARIAAGGRDAGAILADAAATIPRDHRLRLEYLELVDPAEFQPVWRVEGPVVAAGAIWVGGTRLIDNLLCIPRELGAGSERT